jgi:hypothetical protein
MAISHFQSWDVERTIPKPKQRSHNQITNACGRSWIRD